MPFSCRPYRVTPTPADESEIVWRPELKVLVGGTAADIPLWGLVDTGATECVLPHEVADLVKASPRAGTWSLTDYTGKRHDVEYGEDFPSDSSESAQLENPAGPRLSRSTTSWGEPPLWGRCGFLESFPCHIRLAAQAFQHPDAWAVRLWDSQSISFRIADGGDPV